MKINKTIIRAIIIALITGIIIACIPTNVFAVEAEVLKGTFEWVPPFKSESIEETYYYSDNYFIGTSGKDQNEHLRTMSSALCLAMAPALDKESNATNIINLLNEIGFNQNNQIETYDIDEYDIDTIGTVISNKSIGDTTVILVTLRGDKYKTEWASNLIIGEDGDAQGFSETADILLNRIKGYQEKYSIKENVKMLITGYSRAGAVSNLAGKYINENLDEFYLASDDDLYVYTIEAPISSTDTSVYNNIHNITNKNDLIPYVCPVEWNMQNNGVKEEIANEDIEIDAYKLDTSALLMGGPLFVPIVNEETGENYKVTISEFLEEFFHWLTTSEVTEHEFSTEPAINDSDNPFEGLTREAYANVLQPYISKIAYIYFNKTEAEQAEILNFFKTDVLGAVSENKIYLAPLILSDLSQDVNTANMVATYLGGFLDTARENNPNAMSEEEFMVVRNFVTDIEVLKIVNGVARGDIAFTGPSTYYLATLVNNVKTIIDQHYGQITFDLIKSLDSYYTDQDITIKPGTISINFRILGDIETDYEGLKELGFTDEDIDANQRGFDISIVVESIDINGTTLGEEELELINNATEGLTISNFFDIFVVKKIGYNEEIVEGYNKETEVIISIDKKDYKENVDYKIIRLHEGNVDIIDCELLEITDDKVFFKFKTDKFSTYALAYTEKTDEVKEEPVSPNTGDNIAVYITLFVVAAIGSVALFKKK